MSKTVYYTIINSSNYLSNEEFSWKKIMAILDEKLDPNYKVYQGTYCSNIEDFLSQYQDKPVFVPVDNNSILDKGQLFILVDVKNPDSCITDLYMRSDDYYYSSDSDNDSWESEDYW